MTMNDLRLPWVVVALSLVAVPSGAAPQSRPVGKQGGSAVTTSPASGPDVFAGYSWTEAGEATLNGLRLSASFPFRGRIRLAAELSRHSGSFAGVDLKQLAFLAGPRRVWRSGDLSPFAQVMLGAARSKTSLPGGLSDSTTGWGLAPGGGVDYRLSRHWAARGQAQLLFLRGRGVTDTDLGLAIGVTYRPGR